MNIKWFTFTKRSVCRGCVRCLQLLFYITGGQDIWCDAAVQHGRGHHPVYRLSRRLLRHLQVCRQQLSLHCLLCRLQGFTQPRQGMTMLLLTFFFVKFCSGLPEIWLRLLRSLRLCLWAGRCVKCWVFVLEYFSSILYLGNYG